MKGLLLSVSLLFITCCTVNTPNPCCDAPPVAEGQKTWRLTDGNGHGTAFPIICTPNPEKGWDVLMLTAKHVTKDVDHKYHATQDDSDYRLTGGTIISTHLTYDVAMVSFWSEFYVPVIQLSTEDMRIGERVYTAGYQAGDFWITEGLVSSRSRITAPIAPGASGGPVLLPDGRAIAITVQIGTIYSDSGRYQLVFHMVLCIAIADIAPWIREMALNR